MSEPNLYEEDMYTEPTEEEFEGDILSAKGREHLRSVEKNDPNAFSNGMSLYTVGERGPKTYRGEAVDVLLKSGLTVASVYDLLKAADEVAAWLAGSDDHLPASQEASPAKRGRPSV